MILALILLPAGCRRRRVLIRAHARAPRAAGGHRRGPRRPGRLAVGGPRPFPARWEAGLPWTRWACSSSASRASSSSAFRFPPWASSRRESGATRADPEEGFLFDNTPEAVFTACLLGFLSAMTLVTASQHFGLLWVAIEATTLASAPLIHYHRHHRSLEATWKYLLICSVGNRRGASGHLLPRRGRSGWGRACTSLTFDRPRRERRRAGHPAG